MRFNPKARLDSSQVRVRRGGGGGFGGGGFGGGGFGRSRGGGTGFPVPGSRRGRAGGGIGGLVILVLVVLLGGGLGGLGGLTGGGGSAFDSYTAPTAGSVETAGVSGLPQCRTGEDANSDRQCALVAVVNSVQAFWDQALPDQSGTPYAPSLTTFFTGSTETGCGPATSDVGPFYCPADQGVYLDITFFDAMLEGQLGAAGGPFSEAYVLAHEYGHHVQDLLGTMGRVRTQQGPESDAVRLELQADCYAGMWTGFATTVEDANGEVFIEELTQDDVDRALDAAAAVGDDRIQERAGGRSNPETWTHGSAAARQYWFSTGLEEGTLEACDTFSAEDLHLDG